MIDFQIIASGSKGNAYLVTDGETALLLDAGIRIKQLRKMIGFNLTQVAGCLVSHEHGDHACGILDLMKVGIDIYTGQETIDHLQIAGHRLHPVKAKEPFKIGTWDILPFEVPHDVYNLGFFLTNQVNEKLVFAIDCHYIPNRFRGLTHIAVGVNFDPETFKQNVRVGNVHPEVGRRIWFNHMNIETFKRFLRANDLTRVEEIHLLHLSEVNSQAEGFQREIEKATGKPTYIG